MTYPVRRCKCGHSHECWALDPVECGKRRHAKSKYGTDFDEPRPPIEVPDSAIATKSLEAAKEASANSLIVFDDPISATEPDPAKVAAYAEKVQKRMRRKGDIIASGKVVDRGLPKTPAQGEYIQRREGKKRK